MEDLRRHFGELKLIAGNAKLRLENRIAKELALQGGIGVRYGCHCAHILVKRLLRERKLTTSDHRIFSPKYISIESQRPFFVKFHCKTNLKLSASDEMFLKKRLNQELQFEGIPIYFKVSASR